MLVRLLLVSAVCAFSAQAGGKGAPKKWLKELIREYEACVICVLEGPGPKGQLRLREVEKLWERNRPPNVDIWYHVSGTRFDRPGSTVVCLMDYNKHGKRSTSYLNPDNSFKIGTTEYSSLEVLRAAVLKIKKDAQQAEDADAE